LLDLSEPFSFLVGFKWVQNPAELPCNFRIVLARNVGMHPERYARIAVTETLLPDLQLHASRSIKVPFACLNA